MQNQNILFNRDTVVHNYSQVQMAKTREEKNMANQYITQFVASDQAWQIALELLNVNREGVQSSNDSYQQHFIGAQALYQKLDRDFEDQLAHKDEHVIELRGQIFRLLEPQDATVPAYHKTVLQRLCMSISYLALHTNNTCWTTSINDIITFGGSYGPQQCFVALNILKNVCITFESKVFNQKQTALIKRWFKENVNTVFEFSNTILNAGGLPNEVYIETLSVAKHWSNYSRKSFIIQESFIQTVLQLLGNDSSILIFKKVVNLLKKMLQTSDHAKLIGNMRFENLIQPDCIPDKELAFIRHIIDFIHSSKEKFIVSTAENFQVDGDDEEQQKAIFAQKLTHLIAAVSQNYEFIFITPHNTQWSQKLYEVIMIGSRAKNLNIVVQICEFWGEFKQSLLDSVRGAQQGTVSQILQQLDQQCQLCMPFLQICEVLFEQSRLQVVQSSSGLALEMDEYEQDDLRGMSCKAFRQNAEDVFLQAYCMLTSTYGQSGASQFYQMFHQKLDSSSRNILGIEACMFMLKSVEVAIQDDGFGGAKEFVGQVLQKLLGDESPCVKLLGESQNLLLKKGFCQLVQEIAVFFGQFPQYINSALKIILSMSETIQLASQSSDSDLVNLPALETLYVQAVMQICQHCPGKFNEYDFVLLKTHLGQHALSMSQANVGQLMESIALLCSHIPDQQAQIAAINDMFSSPVGLLQQQIQTSDASNLIKAISMITGAVIALKGTTQNVLALTLLQVLQGICGLLEQILTQRSDHKGLITATCVLMRRMFNTLGNSLVSIQLYSGFVSSLVKCFFQNAGNLSCLQTVAKLSAQMGKESPEHKQVVIQNVDLISDHVLKMATAAQNSLDVDLIKDYSEVMFRCAEVDLAHCITSPYFSSSLNLFQQSLEHINSSDLNKSLVSFFCYLLNTVSNKFRRYSAEVQQAFMTFYSQILRSLMLTLTKMNMGKELSQIATAFQNSITWAEHNNFENNLRQEFKNAFMQSETLQKCVKPAYQDSIVDLLFDFRRNTAKIRLSLLQLNSSIVNNSEDENLFMGLQIQASEEKRKLLEPTIENSQKAQNDRVVILD